MDDLQKRIDMPSSNYNKLVQMERYERKKRNEIEQQLEEQKEKVKQQRKKLIFNRMKLNELEKAFQIQKQRTQLAVDTVEHHDKNEQIELYDDGDGDESKQSNLTTNELEHYESSFTWLKKKFQINYVNPSDSFAQVPMSLVVTKRNSDEDGNQTDDDHVYRKSGGDCDDDTSMNYCLNPTIRTLQVNLHHLIVKDLFYRINYFKDDKTTFDFAYVMIEIAALRLGQSLENPTVFADRIESILRQPLQIPLDEQVEDESNDGNLIDAHMDSKRKTTTEIDDDGKDQ